MSILIVDDDAEIRRLLTLFLEYRGYHVVSVTNGAEALTLLRHSFPLPELILSDWMMPVMDGAAFRQAQQQNPQLAPIPVVALSGAAELFADAPSFRPDAYLPKPFDFAKLLILVEQFCTECPPPQRSRVAR
jgi:two-component system, OmpR family, response regulator CpxR